MDPDGIDTFAVAETERTRAKLVEQLSLKAHLLFTNRKRSAYAAAYEHDRGMFTPLLTRVARSQWNVDEFPFFRQFGTQEVFSVQPIDTFPGILHREKRGM